MCSFYKYLLFIQEMLAYLTKTQYSILNLLWENELPSYVI